MMSFLGGLAYKSEEEEDKADLGGSRDQKTPSFKEKKKAQNWFQRQFSREMSRDYDSIELEHATAIAAAAFAMSSQVSEIPQPEASLTKTRSKVDGKKSPISQLGGASKRFSEEKKPERTSTPAPSMKKTPTFSEKSKSTNDKKPQLIPTPRRTPTFGDKQLMDTDDTKTESPKPKFPPTVSLRSPPPLSPPPPPPQLPIRQTSTRARPPTRPDASEAKAEAWEIEEHRKIKDRYERLLETIDKWEKRKKMKARRKLNKQEQSESERKRAKALRKYQDKIRYIDEIAAGARAQADERRRNEVLKAKGKANIIRTTGKLPGPCSCF